MSEAGPAFIPPPGPPLRDEGGWSIAGAPIRGRQCGSCKACCIQVPVTLPDEQKKDNVRCKHLCSRGCRIYEKRPEPCQYWSCKWLFDEIAADLKRPDIGGYIIDPILDTALRDGEPFDFVQVWVDPNRPEAHRAPELRAYVEEIGRRFGMPTMIRWGSVPGMLLIPPSITGHEWIEHESECKSTEYMSQALAAKGVKSRLGRTLA